MWSDATAGPSGRAGEAAVPRPTFLRDKLWVLYGFLLKEGLGKAE